MVEIHENLWYDIDIFLKQVLFLCYFKLDGDEMDAINKQICDNIYSFISKELINCLDTEVFCKTSFEDLGFYYYKKTLDSIDGATDELLQIVIKYMAIVKEPVNSRNEYYSLICKIMNIIKLPKQTLIEVEKVYDEIFVQNRNHVVQKAISSKTSINNSLRSLHSKAKAIEKTTSNYSFMRDLTSDELKLYDYYSRCNSLRTRKEMTDFAIQYMNSILSEFCDFNNPISVDIAKKRKAIDLSCEDAYDVEFTFSVFREIVEIVEDDIDRPYALFYKIKFFTVIEEARKILNESLFTKADETERVEQCKAHLSNIPRIDELHSLKENNASDYLCSLRKFLEDYKIMDSLTTFIEQSVCLRDRRNILKKCIELFRESEFELFDSIIPIQIEGIFADFLKDTTTFRRFTKLKTYGNALLKEKIQYLQDVKSDIYPEAVEYFMFYFNNVIRNKVAHGNYKNICKDAIQAEIFALELVLDMNMLVYMLLRKSETEKMYRFISRYERYYSTLIKTENPCFGALFNDIIGDKTIAEYDSVEKYKPIQVIYWLVNPYYEKIYEEVDDKKTLLDLRDQFLSKEFWQYVLENLDNVIEAGYDYKGINPEFISIINGLFRCNITEDVRSLLGKVSEKYQTISAF